MKEATHTSQPSSKWYHQPAMLTVCGVLLFTFVASGGIIGAALSVDDPMVVDARAYQELRASQRLSFVREENRVSAPSPAKSDSEETGEGS